MKESNNSRLYSPSTCHRQTARAKKVTQSSTQIVLLFSPLSGHNALSERISNSNYGRKIFRQLPVGRKPRRSMMWHDMTVASTIVVFTTSCKTDNDEDMSCPCAHNQLEEASTHKTATNHADSFFCASWPRLLTFWPHNKWISRIHGKA